MQKRGKHISKYFERPEGTQEDVTEMDGLRNRKKRFTVVVSWKTSFHARNRPAEKSFSVVVQQQTEGLV
jgi:hypothetical protein